MPPTFKWLKNVITNVNLMSICDCYKISLLEILSFATCLMQLKNVACNSKIVACEIF